MERLLAVFTAIDQVEKVNLCVVATLVQPPVHHHHEYQYVVQSDNHRFAQVPTDKAEAVFAAVTEDEKVILSVIVLK